MYIVYICIILSVMIHLYVVSNFVKMILFKFEKMSLNYKKRLLLRCIHHFKSDLIYNMDHKRISGTQPSSVILSQTKKFKTLKSDAKNV